jgi:hypothetical protein
MFSIYKSGSNRIEQSLCERITIAVDGIYEYGRNLSPIMRGGKQNFEWLRGRKGTQGKLLNGEW